MNVFKKLGAVAALSVGLVGLTALPALAWNATGSGEGVCDRKTGQQVVTFHIKSWNDQNPGTVTTRLGTKTATFSNPADFVERVGGSKLQRKLDWKITWPHSEETAHGTIVVELRGDCQKPPPPPPTPVTRYPTASFTGPCGDPMYRANLNNTRSTAPVTFRVQYFKYGHGWTSFTRTVNAGVKRSTAYFHVKGETRLKVFALGHVLRSIVSAPGGNYPACK